MMVGRRLPLALVCLVGCWEGGRGTPDLAVADVSVPGDVPVVADAAQPVDLAHVSDMAADVAADGAVLLDASRELDGAPADAAVDGRSDLAPAPDGAVDAAPDQASPDAAVADAAPDAPWDAEPAPWDFLPWDGPTPDASPDARPEPDAAQLDMATPDASPPDAPVPDAAPPDAAPEPDGFVPEPDAGPPPCAPPRVYINEVVAVSSGGFLDEDGDPSDWIELHNAEPVPVSLEGWGLSDDPDAPFSWTFPGRRLAPGEHLVVFASGKDRRSRVTTYDTRVDLGDEWSYLPVVEPPDPTWREPDFDDAGWAVGPSGFGHGDGDDATPVVARTVYARTRFFVEPDEIEDLTQSVLHVDYDDGFAAYINGEEVARENLGPRGVPSAWDAFADGPHEALGIQGRPPQFFDLWGVPPLLRPGVNVLAVEIHDEAGAADDLTLVPYLTFGFASGRPGAPSEHLPIRAARLHTSFSISGEGETLVLTAADGCEVDRMHTGPMRTDFSLGRVPSGGPSLEYFARPTPGAPNEGESYLRFAEPPTFSPAPGYAPPGTGVEIRHRVPGAVVRYTLDGVEPGPDDPQVDGPLVLGAEALVVRARAWEPAAWPSTVATGTWLPGAPPEHLPTLSLVTDPAHFFDELTGIWVFGPPDYSNNVPYFGANFWEDWERPVSAQYFEVGGAPAFSIDCGVKIHGGWSRSFRQRSLRLQMRAIYGAGEIRHRVFPEDAHDSYERLVLRNSGHDWSGCNDEVCNGWGHVREPLVHEIAKGLGIEVLGYQPVSTWLNGEYWGLYNIRERADRRFIEARFGVADVDLLERNQLVLEGDARHYQELLRILREEDVADPEVYARVQGMMETDNFTTYALVEIFVDNKDWPGNNIKFWRPRTPEGRWRWLLYDTDFGLGRWQSQPTTDTLAFALQPNGPGWPNPPWSTELLRALVRNPTFRDHFVNRYADLLNTAFSVSVTHAHLDRVAARIRPEMPRQLERWGGARVDPAVRLQRWEARIAAIRAWLAARPDNAFAHVVGNFGLAGTWQLELATQPPGAGRFELTTIDVEGPFIGRYFRGVPVRVRAVPSPGFVFAGWSGGLGGDPELLLEPDGDVSLTAVFE